MVDIYEHQIAWGKKGLKAEISTPAYPGRTWEGVVEEQLTYPISTTMMAVPGAGVVRG